MFIIPYFGQLPNYFNLWLSTAKKNTSFDFMIITDQTIDGNSENITIMKSSFENLQKKFRSVLGDEIVLNSPYKLNDYRPTFGLVFQDEIKEYDYWGFLDVDTILGDLKSFYTDSYISQSSRIGTRGHLQLFKNDKLVNSRFMEQAKPGFNFNIVKKVNFPMHFDEMWGINHIFKNIDIVNSESNIAFDDISPKSPIFRNLNGTKESVIYEYINGELFEIQENGKKILIPYVHFQKRFLKFEGGIDSNKFKVIPNKFVNSNTLIDWSKINQTNGKFKVLFKYYWRLLKNGEFFMHAIYKVRLIRFDRKSEKPL